MDNLFGDGWQYDSKVRKDEFGIVIGCRLPNGKLLQPGDIRSSPQDYHGLPYADGPSGKAKDRHIFFSCAQDERQRFIGGYWVPYGTYTNHPRDNVNERMERLRRLKRECGTKKEVREMVHEASLALYAEAVGVTAKQVKTHNMKMIKLNEFAADPSLATFLACFRAQVDTTDLPIALEMHELITAMPDGTIDYLQTASSSGAVGGAMKLMTAEHIASIAHFATSDDVVAKEAASLLAVKITEDAHELSRELSQDSADLLLESKVTWVLKAAENWSETELLAVKLQVVLKNPAAFMVVDVTKIYANGAAWLLSMLEDSQADGLLPDGVLYLLDSGAIVDQDYYDSEGAVCPSTGRDCVRNMLYKRYETRAELLDATASFLTDTFHRRATFDELMNIFCFRRMHDLPRDYGQAVSFLGSLSPAVMRAILGEGITILDLSSEGDLQKLEAALGASDVIMLEAATRFAKVLVTDLNITASLLLPCAKGGARAKAEDVSTGECNVSKRMATLAKVAGNTRIRRFVASSEDAEEILRLAEGEFTDEGTKENASPSPNSPLRLRG